ncbi:hypothetical protein [Streptomyces sp. NPDC086182]|uniref:hypothetical protein n=1 Tax=Streptomyces sp. NPDC086182 TaxID=3155058 RepID=UPI00341FDDA8
MSEARLPVFGPTETFPVDESGEPFAVVRLDVAVTRNQLRTAIAIGHAEMAAEPALDQLSTADIRREVEGHLAAGATIELYREQARVVGLLAEADRLAEVDAAVDRAYTTANSVDFDEYRIAQARRALVEAEQLDMGDDQAMARMIGRLGVVLSQLLDVVDGSAQ